MENLLLWVGRLAGFVGVLISLWAAFSRLTGGYYVHGFQIGTLLMVGMTAMLVGCVCFLVVLTSRTGK